MEINQGYRLGKLQKVYFELEKSIVDKKDVIIYTNSKEIKALMAKTHPDITVEELSKLSFRCVIPIGVKK